VLKFKYQSGCLKVTWFLDSVHHQVHISEAGSVSVLRWKVWEIPICYLSHDWKQVITTNAKQIHEDIHFITQSLTKLTIKSSTVRLPVTNLSSQTSGFNARALHVGFVVETVALWQVFLWIFQRSLITTIPSMLHTHISFIYHWCYTTFNKLNSFQINRHRSLCAIWFLPSDSKSVAQNLYRTQNIVQKVKIKVLIFHLV